MTIRLKSLQQITDLKNKLTQQASVAYTESLRLLEDEQTRLRTLLHAQDQAIADLHERTQEGVQSQELYDWTLYMLSQREQIERQLQVIERKHEECTGKRVVLTDRFLDEKKWLKLQERRQWEHNSRIEKRAQEALDEMAVMGYSRVKG